MTRETPDMTRYPILLSGAALLLTAGCGQAPIDSPDVVVADAPAVNAGEASAADPRRQFAGTWELVRVERYDADGELLPPPEPPGFGAGSPLGYIMYDGDGHMGVVIQQDGRDPYAGERRTPEEALAAVTSYTSYFGPYTVNEAEGYVTHHLEGSLSPGGRGRDNQRFYEFSGNQLALKPPAGASGIQLRIVWERVPDLTEPTDEHRRFIGFWEFDSVARRTADGEELPANQWRAGYIIYTPTGHMAVHLARPDRQPYADGTPTPEEADAALGSYASYFGPFTIHADEGYVLHHRVGNTSPTGAGTDAQRFYEFAGNQLILKPPPAMVDGREVQSFIHWNRISAPAE